MDSHDSSAPPPHLSHHHHLHHHLHHPQQQPPSHSGNLMGPQSQNQQHLANNTYQLPNTNNSVHPMTSATTNATMMHQQNPRFPFNPMVAAAAAASGGLKPMDHLQSDGSPSGGGGSGFSIEPVRKKRGRPRKYSPDNSIGLGLSPAPVSQISPAMGHNDSGGGTQSSDTPAKRNRGRPPGSVKRQMDALGVPGVGFTPHVITVNPGEDIASKIMAFSQQGPRTVCILSANGAIGNVTLRQSAMSGGTVTYEGRYEIISLSGSFVNSDSDGNRSRTGSLSVSLAGPDGRVLGGGVAGILKAATVVQVIVGSFIADGKKSKTGTSSHMLNFGGQGTGGASPSPGGSSESDEDNDESPPPPPPPSNPLNRGGGGSGPYGNDNAPQVQNMAPMYSSMGWPGNMKMIQD